MNLSAEHGFLLVNKPSGISSFAVVKRVRGVVPEKKIGHAGTLDPFAEGLLILAIGRSFTKHIDRFQALQKHYSGTMLFGKESSTYDPEGEIVSETGISDIEYTAEEFESALKALLPDFIGTISQVPPRFSAKKVDGKRAYALARKGEAVELEAKEVEIQGMAIDAIRFSEFPEVDFTVHCSKGTYIRSLAHDMGQKMGMGAYLSQLSRVGIGDYSVDDAIGLDELSFDSVSQGVFRGLPVQ